MALTAIAHSTSRVRIGALVTPLPRRRPWKVAREAVSVDRLSGGRLVVGVGLGDNPHEFEAFGEPGMLATRAAMLDEGLEILEGLWSGEQFSFQSDHYTVERSQFLPRPAQTPRIPIWVAGSWPNRAPFRRAARWDGAICALAEPGPHDTPVSAIAEISDLIRRERRVPGHFDLVIVTGNPEWKSPEVVDTIGQYEEAGLTWWLEDIGPWRFGGNASAPWPLESMRERVRAGPPRR